MLNQVDILKATRNKIKDMYPNIPIYLEEVKEGFKSPAFFLKLLIVKSPVSGFRNYNDCTLYITYFSKKGETDSLEMYAIKDNILNAFWSGIQVTDRYIKFNTVSSTTDGTDADIIMFDLPFVYYDCIEQHNSDYLIEHINTSYRE